MCLEADISLCSLCVGVIHARLIHIHEVGGSDRRDYEITELRGENRHQPGEGRTKRRESEVGEWKTNAKERKR